MNETERRIEELCGVWRLVSLDAIKPDGKLTTGWLGPRPAGLLVYDRSGYLAVQIMRGPRERTVPDQMRASRPQYYAYFGTFEVDERAHTIVHRVQGSLFPDEAGVSYRQDVTVFRDHLILVTARHLVDGEERRNRIEWQRVEERAAELNSKAELA
ncbi:MAG TPA: lipocalin-like domain-containing protein [Gemmatimonadaceae bacterium]|nr:lipocalin-like domain-containing protein [Gemmatimonadaceae bacterium]